MRDNKMGDFAYSFIFYPSETWMAAFFAFPVIFG
jgi:hypothetical protein